ncbi:hypothetical protein HYW72_00185 [Candidatus Nomurabacteria bacterium]|nr:hypothetical protein [Candidatus Nomurabacteria bacterium]
MSIESRNQERNPTPQDLQNLTIRVDNLGRGDFVHDINGYMSNLHAVMEIAKEKGWTDDYLEIWRRNVGEIDRIIVQVKLDQAKEKGLL